MKYLWCLLHPERINVCPTNMFEVLVRCLDIVLDASARREFNQAEAVQPVNRAGSVDRWAKTSKHFASSNALAVNTDLLGSIRERSKN